MNLLELERGVTMTSPPVEVPGTIIELKREGYAIEKNPMPLTMFIPESSTESILEGAQQPETDTAVVGEDRAAVAALIVGGNIIRPVDIFFEPASSEPEELQESPESPAASEKSGRSKDMLLALRRSRLGIFAATVATTAVALLSAHTENAKGATEPVLVDNVPTLNDSAILSGTPEATPSTSPEATASDAGVPEYDPEALKQYCTDVALTKPEIVKAQLRNVGSFEHIPLEAYALSTQSQPWPEQCKRFYGPGLQARGQALHNGHYVNMNYWRSLDVFPDTGKGNWPGDIANLDNLRFPVCKARILLKANIVDLSVSMNEDIPWKQHHPTIARTRFAPIPAEILPRKPKAC